MTVNDDVLEQLYILPADATLVPVAALSPRVRATLGPLEAGDGDVAVSRPRYRVPTRLISPELAALLGEFREPSRIVDAVLRFSQARSRDPFETLDDAFDALALFINSRVLVGADAPDAEAIVATLAPGQAVYGYEVERLVSALEDTEVYLTRDAREAAVAVKLARPGAPDSVALGLAAEARILRHLGGGRSPALIEEGSYDGRPFLAQEWRPGYPLTEAARHARAGSHARRRLHALCTGVLTAYAWLHAEGVVHGDVHPGNAIVSDDGDVTILDFGRARLLTSTTAEAEPTRAGVAYFYEPEMARALLAGRVPPAATQVGEQYALAALLYFLITGVHYMNLSAERDVLLGQIVDRAVLPFTARGLEPWPAVEAVLATALAKDPNQRFPSVARFLAAFESAGRREAGPRHAVAAPAFVADFVADALRPPGADAGRAGSARARDLAWFACRAAQTRGDPELLAGADVWACRAARSGPPDWALAAVTAAIHRARGDSVTQAHTALTRRSATDGLDLLGGRSGLLVAMAQVLDGLRDGEAEDAPLARSVRQTIDTIWQEVDDWDVISACPELPHLGMAHGWAGLLYATLFACRAAATPRPHGVGERLEQLAELAQSAGRGVTWAGTLPHAGITHRTPTRAPGWCSGSAGHALMWILAHEEIGDRRYLDLAERAARYAVEHPSANPDVCCGTTGRGFALLRLYQATGETRWLVEARRLAHAAAAGWPAAADRFNLLKGPLGTALLLIELEAPECLVQPVLA